MTSQAQTVVFLHGIGADSDSWDAQLIALPNGYTRIAPQVAGLTGGESFTLGGAAAAIRDDLDQRGVERAHLCGLSLGGMVATRFALDYPDRIASLVLSGSQVRPNPTLMRVQNRIMRLLPERFVAPPGLTKHDVIAILRGVAATDFRAELTRIAVPTLVLCGTKDRPNLPAAREFAALIEGAELQLVPGAGHEWNVQLPAEFNARLTAFYARQHG